MRVSKKGVPLIAIGVVLIALATALTLYNCYESCRAGELSQEAVAQLDDKISSASADYGINQYMDMPVTEVGGHDYIGTLEISSLGLKLPVMNSFSYDNLSVAPCCYSGSIYNSNMVIAGHNYQTHFGKLKYLNIGDEVVFTDSDGNTFLYDVKNIEILPPTAVGQIRNSEWDLTLFTCTVGAKTRLVIRCNFCSTANDNYL